MHRTDKPSVHEWKARREPQRSGPALRGTRYSGVRGTIGLSIGILLLFAGAAYASIPVHQNQAHGFPENYEARRMAMDIIEMPAADLIDLQPSLIQQRGTDHMVRISSAVQNGYVYVLFVNTDSADSPVYSQGSMIIKRSLADGSFAQIKVFLRDDPGFYARIRPRGDRSEMDIYVADVAVHRNLVLPFAFRDVLQRPFSDTVERSSFLINWADIVTDPDPWQYRHVRNMVDQLRPALSWLPDAEDGSMNEQDRKSVV